MDTTMNKRWMKLISVMMALVAVITSFSACSSAMAASKSPASAYASVVKAYGKSFPLNSSNRISGKARIFGVQISGNVSSYYAAQKVTGGSKREYAIFICKANKGKKSSVKSALKKWKKNERNSMNNYLDSTGKKLFSKAKIGSVGNYVYMVMVDTSGNKKAVNAIKKTLK